jgi:hypothetical protein
VRVVDSTEGRLRGVVERISDQSCRPFSDSGQLIAFLNEGDETESQADSKHT